MATFVFKEGFIVWQQQRREQNHWVTRTLTKLCRTWPVPATYSGTHASRIQWQCKAGASVPIRGLVPILFMAEAQNTNISNRAPIGLPAMLCTVHIN
jgi:hypothetical protein